MVEKLKVQRNGGCTAGAGAAGAGAAGAGAAGATGAAGIVKKNDPEYVQQLVALLNLSRHVHQWSFGQDVPLGRALWVRL